MEGNSSLLSSGNSCKNSPVFTGMTGSNIPSIDCSGSRSNTQKLNRCVICTKKTGLTGFKCRCGDNFCGIHRYPDEHGCKFDYKTMEREQLGKKLLIGPLSVKLEQI